jgi:hypothetical protein
MASLSLAPEYVCAADTGGPVTADDIRVRAERTVTLEVPSGVAEGQQSRVLLRLNGVLLPKAAEAIRVYVNRSANEPLGLSNVHYLTSLVPGESAKTGPSISNFVVDVSAAIGADGRRSSQSGGERVTITIEPVGKSKTVWGLGEEITIGRIELVRSTQQTSQMRSVAK